MGEWWRGVLGGGAEGSELAAQRIFVSNSAPGTEILLPSNGILLSVLSAPRTVNLLSSNGILSSVFSAPWTEILLSSCGISFSAPWTEIIFVLWFLVSNPLDRDCIYWCGIFFSVTRTGPWLSHFSFSVCLRVIACTLFILCCFTLKVSLKKKKKEAFFGNNNSSWQVAVDVIPTVNWDPKKLIINRICLTLVKYTVTLSTVVMLNFPSDVETWQLVERRH